MLFWRANDSWNILAEIFDKPNQWGSADYWICGSTCHFRGTQGANGGQIYFFKFSIKKTSHKIIRGLSGHTGC